MPRPARHPEAHWDRLTGAERFYLKLLDLEARGPKTLDNYQNFAKAFKVRDFRALMASQRANEARLKSAVEFGKTEMSEGSELHQSVLRAVLYAMMELVKNVDGNDVLAHLTLNVPDYYGDRRSANWPSNWPTTSPRGSKRSAPTKPPPPAYSASW